MKALSSQPLDYERGPICPSCERKLPFGAKICVDCGIHVKSGRRC